ncbi:MAG: LapA family protein [Candidatus Krumholzibacteriota bacterium]|nr:LapA family protein [Candidatus Krumholzibacteriota bacterium]
MWILQRLLVVLALAMVLLFGMLNAGEKVTVHYWFGYSFANSPLPLVMVTFFLIGVLFYYLFSVAREWRLRAEIRRLRRVARSTDSEIQQLRRISLEEDLGPEPALPDDERAGP